MPRGAEDGAGGFPLLLALIGHPRRAPQEPGGATEAPSETAPLAIFLVTSVWDREGTEGLPGWKLALARVYMRRNVLR